MKGDLSAATKAHILEGMPKQIWEAYGRAVRKSRVALVDPDRRIKFKHCELRAMNIVDAAFDDARSHRRIKGLTVVQ